MAGSSEDRPRNPFRSEADAFRVLVIVVGATAMLVAVTLLTTPLAGALLMGAFLAVAGWRSWGLLRDWRERGSDPTRGSG